MQLPILHQANADFVTTFLAIGGDLANDPHRAVSQAVELADAGITHVLDARLEWEDSGVWEALPEVDYRWDGIDDAGQRVPASWFEGIVSWALRAIENDGVVLTHCHMGINRGPSAGYAVLLAMGWDPVDALAAIRTARPIAAIAYYGDALEWHFDRTGASAEVREEVRLRTDLWHRANPIDAYRIIRAVRLGESVG